MDEIEDLLDNFDFQKVKRTMDAVNWTWASTRGVPDIPDLRKQARELLRMAVEYPRDHYFVATGGLVVRKRDGLLSLTFEVADWYVELL
jgi:hypothetical protein